MITYTALQERATKLLESYGSQWVVTRKGVRVGKLAGFKAAADTSAIRNGLTLSSTSTVELIMEAAPVIIPGDVLTSGSTSFIVSSVSKLEPTTTTVIQKVTAA